MTNQIKNTTDNKRTWVRPSMQRIAAGSAESGRLNITDGGGGAQAS